MTAEARALMVYCTCPDPTTATLLAEAAVERGLAACVNQIDAVSSVFRWQGALGRERECLLLAKTTPDAYPALEALWIERHPYELPEVVAVPIAYASEAYLAWIESSVTSR